MNTVQLPILSSSHRLVRNPDTVDDSTGIDIRVTFPDGPGDVVHELVNGQASKARETLSTGRIPADSRHGRN
jgi:hypothetical protein